MTAQSPKIGAIFYLLWGLLHIAGGAYLLVASFQGLEGFLLGLTGSQVPGGVGTGNDLALRAITEVSSYHAFNLVWLGLLVSMVAVRLNWKNSLPGYWINLALVGFIDLGLVLFMVVPGVMSILDAWIGPLLYVFALGFSTVGVGRKGPSGKAPIQR